MAMAGNMIDARGKFEFETDHEVGTGSFELSYRTSGKKATGRLVFGGEGIHIDHAPALSPGEGYPDVTVTIEDIPDAKIKGGTATITAMGRLHQEPVKIDIKVTDSGSKSVADTFWIRCRALDGRVYFAVGGSLIHGDVILR